MSAAHGDNQSTESSNIEREDSLKILEQETVPLDPTVTLDEQRVSEEAVHREESGKEKRERKGPIDVTRDPGKSLLPFSRVQKVVKADRDLPMIAKEATFLISVAAEEFIKRMAAAGQRVAEREKRATIQYKDIATVIHKNDEFMFLEEMIPWMLPHTTEKRKPKALEEKEQTGPSALTMLDQFVIRPDTGEKRTDIILHEDGTMGTRNAGDNV